jgi:hypothetical protein
MAQFPPLYPPAPVAPTEAFVPVKSAWLSKINWTQLAGPAVSLLALFGIKDVTPEQMGAIIVGIQTLQSVLTGIIKTFYTGTITPSSAAKIPPGGG